MLPRRLLILSAAVAAAAGCGGPDRTVVRGEVTYRGQPVADGEVRLYPKAGTEAPMTGALVRDGRYAVDARGGVLAGTYRVEVTANRSRPQAGADVEKADAGGQYLPAKFNAKTELELVVPPSRDPVTHDLHLKD
jgi:hypothetical protein